MSEAAAYKYPFFLYVENPNTCISLYDVTRNIIPTNTVSCSTTQCIDFDLEKTEKFRPSLASKLVRSAYKIFKKNSFEKDQEDNKNAEFYADFTSGEKVDSAFR
jgi:hypothetical protein